MTTQIADVIVPAVFTPYVQQMTAEKSRLVQSGIVTIDEYLSGLLSSEGGLTFHVPSFRDLATADADRVSTDAKHFSFETGVAVGSGAGILDPDPFKITTQDEVCVRLNRNGSWSSMDLAAALAGADPMQAIASRVADWRVRRLQLAFVATMGGVSKDNGVNDSGDYANDIAGSAFADGVTNFSAEAFLDALLTMGDSQQDLTGMIVHSVVFNRMQKNNLIDFIPDATGQIQIPTFLGREVIIDDGMPFSTSAVRGVGTAGAAGIYETWIFSRGAVRMGVGSPKVPTEVERKAGAGNGGGQEVLYNRWQWIIHPIGHAFSVASPASGGPSNAATTGNLNIATSWNRIYGERKQIKFARLITREF